MFFTKKRFSNCVWHVFGFVRLDWIVYAVHLNKFKLLQLVSRCFTSVYVVEIVQVVQFVQVVSTFTVFFWFWRCYKIVLCCFVGYMKLLSSDESCFICFRLFQNLKEFEMVTQKKNVRNVLGRCTVFQIVLLRFRLFWEFSYLV